MISNQAPKIDPTLANRFLAHQLSDAERVLLEAQLMVNSDVVKELEATARLKVGLHRLRQSGELDALLTPPARSYRSLSLLAAGLLVAAILVISKLLVTDSRPLLAASIQELQAIDSTLPTGVKVFSILSKRSNNDRTLINLPSARQIIQLRVFPNVDSDPPYRITLTSIDAAGSRRRLATTVIVRADQDSFISVFLDSAALKVSRYELAVSSEGKPDAEERFKLDVH